MKTVTVTLNPALDKTAVLDELQPGELNRLREVVTDAGGKGVNVSKMLHALGGESTATGFLGGGSGEEIARALGTLGIRHDFVHIAGATRTNLKVVDHGSRLTELNEPGAVVTPDELEQLSDKLRNMANADALFVFSGSIPRGVEPDVYGRFIEMVKARGAAAFLDADGEPFRRALSAHPDFIKPNRHELLEYFGLQEDPGLAKMAGLCRELLSDGVKRVAMSMGGEGALFVDASGAVHAPGLDVPAQSSVGAGDSMVGAMAYAWARGLPWRDAAVLAMASSAGAVTTSGTKPPSLELVNELAARVQLIPVQ